MSNNRNGSPERQSPGSRGFHPAIWVFLFLALLAVFAYQKGGMMGDTVENLDISELEQKIEAGNVKQINIEEETGQITGEYHADGRAKDAPARFSSNTQSELLEQFRMLLKKHGVRYRIDRKNWFVAVLESVVLPLVVIFLLFYFLIFRQMRGAGGGGILSFGKSRAVRVPRDKTRKTFDDVAGIDEAREEVKEIIEFLRTPEKFQRLGGRLPKGVLLIGPPGTGKTLLAKAIAGEADVPFFSISGSDFVEMFVGVGASRVRDLFDQAKQNSPCIIFLDEIDAVGRRRSHDLPGSGVETAQTLNAILVEMDGFTSDDNVIVMAATNRPDVLDPALLRPGRFDRRIHVDLPDIRGREAILKVHAKNVRLADEVEWSVIARGTPMFSGAELENLVNEAALLAVMKELESVDMVSLEEARDKVLWGKERRSRVMDDKERRSTAYHEAGHALLQQQLPEVPPLHKVTIIPRGMALGATMNLPERDEYSLSRQRVIEDVMVALGGRAAEELFLDDITTGGSHDFAQASTKVRKMVCEWGMSEALGLVRYSERGDAQGGFFEGREFSEATAEKIDNEVRRIIDECYEKAKAMLEENRVQVDLLVEALMEFEMLSREELELLFAEKNLDTIRAQRAILRAKNGNGKDLAGTAAASKDTLVAPADSATNPPESNRLSSDASTENKASDDTDKGASV